MPNQPGLPRFQNLKAWKEATDLVAMTYAICAKQRRHLDLKLSDQIKSAVVSIPPTWRKETAVDLIKMR